MDGITSPKTDTLLFLDQCTFVCLKYVVRYGNADVQNVSLSGKENLRGLCDVATREAAEFGEDNELIPLVLSADYLVSVTDKTTIDSLRLRECLKTLQSFLEQDVFTECAEAFIRPPVDSMEKVALLTYLIYKTCEVHGKDKIGHVIDIGVRYMRKLSAEFINAQGGWKGIAALSQTQGQGDFAQSIVFLSPEEMKSCIAENLLNTEDQGESFDMTPQDQRLEPLSLQSSPPFSVPSSINTDDDRESLATPPEMVEKPMLTQSYIEAMGREGIEIPSQSVYVEQNPVSDVLKPTTEQEAATATIHVDQPTSLRTVARDEPQSEELANPKQEDSVLGGYLPHLSFGVAAAAALAGFFVLKRNT